MMSSISDGIGMHPPPPNTNSSTNITSEQQAFIEETLAQYDADNLSEQEAIAIVDAFAESEINPSAQFAKILSASGFDARELGDLAKVNENGNSGGNRPPPPSPQDAGEISLSSIVDYLDGLSDDTSTSTSIAAELANKFGLSEGQSLINISA